MKQKRLIGRSLLVLVGCTLLTPLVSKAQNGTWNTTSTPSAWTTAGNWQGNTIANGSGNTADFSQLNLPGDTTVTLGADRTIGNLVFGDTNTGTSGSWILSGANTLTLAGTTPTVNALGSINSVQISTPLAGTNGLVKSGSGLLELSNNGNSLSGPIMVNAGRLHSDGGIPFQNVTGTVTVASGASFAFSQNFTSGADLKNNLVLSGPGDGEYGALNLARNATSTGTITLAADTTISHDWNNGTIEGSVTGVNTDLTLDSTKPGQLFLTLDGNISLGTGILIKTGDNGVTLNGSNSYSAAVIETGILYFEQSAAMGGSGANITVQDNGLAVRNGTDLQNLINRINPASTGVVAFGGSSSSATTALDFSAHPSLSLGADDEFTYSGTLTPGGGAYRLGGGGATFTVSSSLTGSNGLVIEDPQGGEVVLTGTRSYTGGTTIESGTLRAEGALNGTVTLMSGGTLAPGPVGSTGSLTLNQGLTVDGNLTFRVDRGASQTADVLTVPALTFNGSLTVENIGAALQLGDSFQLFSVSGSVIRNSLSLNLPSLNAGLTWDFGNLLSTGSISVVAVSNTIGYPEFPELLFDQLESVYLAGFSSATINPGTYRLPDGESYESFFNLVGWNNFTINADNVLFLVGKNRTFYVRDCNNITITGATIRAAYPSFTQGKVLSKGFNPDNTPYAMWQISDGYPQFSINEDYVPTGSELQAGFAFNAVDAVTSKIDLDTGDNYRMILYPQGNNTWKIDFDERSSLPFEVDDWLVTRISDSQSHAVYLHHSTNCTINGVTSQGGGFATYFEIGGGGNSLLNCRIERSPVPPDGGTELPVVSNSSDGIHTRDTYPGMHIENFVTTGVMLDDCIAIHGYYETILSVSGNTVTFSDSNGGLFVVGEAVRINNENGFFEEVTCTAIADLGGDVYQLTLDQTLPIPVGSKMCNPKYNGDGFRIINCDLAGTRSRAILTKADNGIISGNTIEYASTAIKVGPEYYWNESGYSWNVLMENNTIRDCKYGIRVVSDGARGNRDIVIRNNTIEDLVFPAGGRYSIRIEGSERVTIEGNHFGVPTGAETMRFEDSDDITLANNLVAYAVTGDDILRVENDVTNLQGQSNGVLYSGLPYALTNSLSGLLLVNPFSNAAGDSVQQYTEANASGRWILQPGGAGKTKVVSAANGLVLGASNQSSAGTPLVLENDGAGDGQQWTLKPVGATTIELVNKLSGLSASVLTSDAQETVSQAVSASSAGQLWSLSVNQENYATWATANGVSSDPTADDDLDGIINLGEYALATNATVPDRAAFQDIETLNVGGDTADYLTITFDRRVDANDIRITVKSTTDLATWPGSAFLVDSVSNPDGTTTETWRSIPVSEGDRNFLGVFVETIP